MNGEYFALETFVHQQPPGKGVRRLEYRVPCVRCGKPSFGLWMQGNITGGLLVGLCLDHKPELKPL